MVLKNITKIVISILLLTLLVYGAYQGGRLYRNWAGSTYTGSGFSGLRLEDYRNHIEAGIVVGLAGLAAANLISLIPNKLTWVITVLMFFAGVKGSSEISNPSLENPKWLSEYASEMEAGWARTPDSAPWYGTLESVIRERWNLETLSASSINDIEVRVPTSYPKRSYSFRPKRDDVWASTKGKYQTEDFCLEFQIGTSIPIKERDKAKISFWDYFVQKC